MELQEKQVTLRKLVASEGKILVSKSVDEDGLPVVKATELYLAEGDSTDNYEEIDKEVEFAE